MKCLRLIFMLPLFLAIASCASGDLRWDNPDPTFSESDDWGMRSHGGRVTGFGPQRYVLPIPEPPVIDFLEDEK